MRPNQFWPTYSRVAFLVLSILILLANTFATTPTEKVVYSFLGSPDGFNPWAGLVADAAGNLYGTTIAGGTAACRCGTIFELSPPATAGGAWTETVLYSFRGGTIDTGLPLSTLIFDKQGNLYGTTFGEGVGTSYGSVFELSPPTTTGGSWTETVLWAFDLNDATGYAPFGKLVIDANGNLYGTAGGGGLHAKGTVFELIAPKTSGGLWTSRVLHNFGAVKNDGALPHAGLLLRGGVLYGTTYEGGTGGQGIVFQLVRKPGPWTETILYNFTGSGGSNPQAELIADGSGNLYGTTSAGGSAVRGTVFELSPPAVAGGPWQETTVHNFTGGGDGGNPAGPLWHDKFGDLFGMAASGGRRGGGGTVFKLKPSAVSGGPWAFVFVYNFKHIGGDALFPVYSGLIFANGAFYGTTAVGGAAGQGAVFSLVF